MCNRTFHFKVTEVDAGWASLLLVFDGKEVHLDVSDVPVDPFEALIASLYNLLVREHAAEHVDFYVEPGYVRLTLVMQQTTLAVRLGDSRSEKTRNCQTEGPKLVIVQELMSAIMEFRQLTTPYCDQIWSWGFPSNSFDKLQSIVDLMKQQN